MAVDARADALAIWQAGVEAVRSDRLVQDNVVLSGDALVIGKEEINLASIGRIVVVGAGKAGAGMASGLEQALGPLWLEKKHVTGWVNVPADCVRPLARVHLHAARPAGVNEPTADGVYGTERILELVRALGPRDLCLCLISGGGSALLPAPVAGISLQDKQALTRHLSGAGANIQQLNTVRKQLSRIKGGGLARACRAGRLISLVISDVLGDPLDVIASGPTVADQATPQDALAIVQLFDDRRGGIPPAVFEYLSSRENSLRADTGGCRVTNLVIGNNATAVDAAGQEAIRRGYTPAMTAATALEGPAEEIGEEHARQLQAMLRSAGTDCLITGGEPVVRLVPAAERGRGGRNQQLVLAALAACLREQRTGHIPFASTAWSEFALLSGGTDGEDGPTDAAGALFDAEILRRVLAEGRDPADFLQRNDAYRFFEPLGGLIKTGPTHTNVCDLRVVLTARRVR